MLQQLAARIKQAKSLLLTTHKQCDGDGLGAALACYHALKKQGKKVHMLSVDKVPQKYNFLNHHSIVQNYEASRPKLEPTDLALIFDTNDSRLIEPLYSELKKTSNEILFIDHHPPLQRGPQPTPHSYIDVQAASTGEIVFELLQHLGVELDTPIAQALYTSVVFDTQMFRHIKNSPKSLQVGGQLIKWLKSPEAIHRALFSNYTPASLTYLGHMLHQVEYFAKDRIAVVGLRLKDLDQYKLKAEDVKDVIDMMSLVSCVECAVVLREEKDQTFKLSLRTQSLSALNIAEHFGGGGHKHAAGALMQGEYAKLKKQIIDCIKTHL